MQALEEAQTETACKSGYKGASALSGNGSRPTCWCPATTHQVLHLCWAGTAYPTGAAALLVSTTHMQPQGTHLSADLHSPLHCAFKAALHLGLISLCASAHLGGAGHSSPERMAPTTRGTTWLCLQGSMRLAAIAGVEELGQNQKQEAAHTLRVRTVQPAAYSGLQTLQNSSAPSVQSRQGCTLTVTRTGHQFQSRQYKAPQHQCASHPDGHSALPALLPCSKRAPSAPQRPSSQPVNPF